MIREVLVLRVSCKVSDSFEVKMGLRQGCVMSPWLFNMYMDGVVREVYIRVTGKGVKMREGMDVESVAFCRRYCVSGAVGRTTAVPGSGV